MYGNLALQELRKIVCIFCAQAAAHLHIVARTVQEGLDLGLSTKRGLSADCYRKVGQQ